MICQKCGGPAKTIESNGLLLIKWCPQCNTVALGETVRLTPDENFTSTDPTSPHLATEQVFTREEDFPETL